MRIFLAGAALALLLGSLGAPARATGTVRILQSDGSDRTYNDVHVAVNEDSMSLTSADGKGTLVIGKAACTKSGELLRCLPFDATLFQNGEKARVALTTGTVWLNPSSSTQTLSHSSQQIPPKGVLMAIRTKSGTYVTLTGVVDEIDKQ